MESLTPHIKKMLNMNSKQLFYPLVDYCVCLEVSLCLFFLACKRRDTSFRAEQVEVVDMSTEQLTVDSLLTPSE